MINKNIISVLSEHNFNVMKNTNPQYYFFCKDTKESFSTIVLIDDIKYPTKTDSLLLNSIQESLEKTFFLRGYKQVDILFVIFTNNPFDYKSLADSDFAFWLSDMNEKRIISYSSDDDSFSDIRPKLENALVLTDSKRSNRIKSNISNTQKKPVFALIFALINTMIFIGFELFGDINDVIRLYSFGALEWHSVIEQSEYYRLFTSMFIHFDFSHLSSNMISLLAISSHLEPSISHIRYIVIYIVSGLCASISSVIYHAHIDETVISVGASGAIFGVFGAYAVYALFNKLNGQYVSAGRIAIVSLLMLYSGMSSPSIDNAAHLGGIICGCLIAFICCISSKNKI